MDIYTGKDFGTALCAHFGLPPDQVLTGIRVNTQHNDAFSVDLTITLSPADLAAIATHMDSRSDVQQAAPAEEPALLAELKAINARLAAMQKNSERFAAQFDQVTAGGHAVLTR